MRYKSTKPFIWHIPRKDVSYRSDYIDVKPNSIILAVGERLIVDGVMSEIVVMEWLKDHLIPDESGNVEELLNKYDAIQD
jgi:hypothetical protein